MSGDLIVARVVHLISAAIWFGGIVFIAAVAVPYARSLGDERRGVAAAIGRRFRPVAWTALAGLVASGVFTMHRFGLLSWSALQGSEYGKGLTIKVALAAAILVLAVLHDFVLGPRVERGGSSRGALVALARANGVLSLLVLILGVVLAH